MNLKQNKTDTARGFTVIEMLVVVVGIAVMGFIILPVLARRKARSSRASCQNNVKQIGLAFRVWEGDFDDHYPMTLSTNKGGTMEWGAGSNMYRHFQVMGPWINNPKILLCPYDNRTPVDDFSNLSNSNLSFFVGLDADETRPRMILTGDRNLVKNGASGAGLMTITTNDKLDWTAAMHNRAGNIGLADGSVTQVDGAGLQQLIQQSGTNMNRLAVP